MNTDLDPNKIAAEFISTKIDLLVDSAKGLFDEAVDKARLKMEGTYQKYLANLIDKFGKAKSFMLKGESVYLYKFYIPISLKMGGVILADVGLRGITSVAKYSIITGSAGSGKSMLFRHLLLDCLANKIKIPIFIELRQFNAFDGDFFDLILKNLKAYKLNYDVKYIKKALEKGHFVLFLDGYDEIVYEKREKIRQWITEFVQVYDNNYFVITSRNDQELEGWQLFSLFNVMPLSSKKAEMLVEKLPHDMSIKNKFINDLKGGMFDKHKSFLSNPLLLSIMLLSYGQSANVPDKLCVFYRQAYEALYERHDVSKEGYRRQIRSGMDIHDFARLFSGFCILTYDKRRLEFGKVEVVDYIEDAQKLIGINCDKSKYFHDLIQAVCMLIYEGLNIVFTHRSFQEYFAAKFICDAPTKVQKKLISKYLSNFISSDNLLYLLYEMKPEIVEEEYILPMINNILSAIGFKYKVGITHFRKFCKYSFDGFHLQGGDLGYIANDKTIKIAEFISFLKKIYWGKIGFDYDIKSEKEKLNRYLKMKTLKNGIKYAISSKEGEEILRTSLAVGVTFSPKALEAMVKIRSMLLEKCRVREDSLLSIVESGMDQ